ncbi:MAG: DUF1648 domain-containing protein [Planctomycetales bacterium]|nr:DUF1648 domain-containing protein [bacterium]UNM07451.1 MAG: DUF1648 domain-containing protein [Planctomycetales bacterium]
MGKLNLNGPVKLTDYILPVLCFIASWAIGGWFYSQMPAEVPVHWGLNGQPDRFGSRFEGAFAVPIILTLLTIMFAFLSRTRAGRLMLACAWITGLFMIAIQYVIGINSLGVGVDVGRFVMLSMAGLFLALGFIVPMMPQNRWGGFRNSYTLSDMRVWQSTNKLGGRMLLLTGLLIIPLAFAPPLVSFVASFVVITVCIVVVPMFHSMKHYRQLKGQH